MDCLFRFSRNLFELVTCDVTKMVLTVNLKFLFPNIVTKCDVIKVTVYHIKVTGGISGG